MTALFILRHFSILLLIPVFILFHCAKSVPNALNVSWLRRNPAASPRLGGSTCRAKFRTSQTRATPRASAPLLPWCCTAPGRSAAFRPSIPRPNARSSSMRSSCRPR